MNASADLFNLIKSLTSNEKRYFKIFASKHVIGNKNNYEKLFDAIDSLPPDIYDEAAFKRTLKGKSWVKNFAVEKNNLEELLLKSMRSYHAEKTIDGEIGNLVANIQILYDKGLIAAADKALAKALDLATRHSKLTALTTLYYYKLLLTKITKSPAELLSADKDFNENTRIMKMLDMERRTYYLKRKITNLNVTGKLTVNNSECKKIIKELEEIISSPLVTVQARLNCLSAKVVMFENERNYIAAFETSLQIIDILDNNEVHLNEPSSSLRIALANYLHNCMLVERFDEFGTIINKIEQLPAETPREKVEVFRITMHYRLIYYLNTPVQYGSVEMVNEIEKGLKKFADLIPVQKKFELRFNICLLFLKQRNYDKLVNAIHKIYEVIGRNSSLNTQLRDLKFMEAVAHLNLENYSLVIDHLRNLERWLKKNKLNNNFTAKLLKTLREMTRPGASKNLLRQLADAECTNDLKQLKEILIAG